MSRRRTRVALLGLALCYSVVPQRSAHKPIPYEDSKRMCQSNKIKLVIHLLFFLKVSIKATKKEERPGADTILTIRGTPNSNAAILAVDKSIYLLRDSHKLTSEVVSQRVCFTNGLSLVEGFSYF